MSGEHSVAQRWSTPVREYHGFGSYYVAAAGDGRWQTSSGDYTYIEFHLDDITYNPSGSKS